MQQFEKYGDGTKIKKLVKNLVRQKKLNFLFRVMNIKFFYNSLWEPDFTMNVTDQGFTRGECFKNDEFMIDFQIDKSDLFLSVLPSLKKDLICILKEINLEYRIWRLNGVYAYYRNTENNHMRYTSKFCKRPRAKSFSDSSIDEFIQTLLSKIIADSTERRGVHTLSEVRIYISFKKD